MGQESNNYYFIYLKQHYTCQSIRLVHEFCKKQSSTANKSVCIIDVYCNVNAFFSPVRGPGRFKNQQLYIAY